jgi:hypothetical protein
MGASIGGDYRDGLVTFAFHDGANGHSAGRRRKTEIADGQGGFVLVVEVLHLPPLCAGGRGTRRRTISATGRAKKEITLTLYFIRTGPDARTSST